MTRKTALGYARISGAGQLDGSGLDRQEEAIREFARTAGLQILEVIQEQVSGKRELEHRAGLAQLLEMIDNNGVRVVVIERADRLARDLVVSELLLAEFRRRDVQVLSADGSVELTAEDSGPTGKLVRRILGAIAEFDRDLTVAKLKAGRERRRSAGERVEGVRPYGDLSGEENGVQALLRLARRRNGRRRSCQAIAEEMDRLGHPPRSGGEWSRSSVRAVLRRLGK